MQGVFLQQLIFFFFLERRPVYISASRDPAICENPAATPRGASHLSSRRKVAERVAKR